VLSQCRRPRRARAHNGPSKLANRAFPAGSRARAPGPGPVGAQSGRAGRRGGRRGDPGRRRGSGVRVTELELEVAHDTNRLESNRCVSAGRSARSPAPARPCQWKLRRRATAAATTTTSVDLSGLVLIPVSAAGGERPAARCGRETPLNLADPANASITAATAQCRRATRLPTLTDAGTVGCPDRPHLRCEFRPRGAEWRWRCTSLRQAARCLMEAAAAKRGLQPVGARSHSVLRGVRSSIVAC